MRSIALAAERRCPGFAFALVVAVESVLAWEEPTVERSGTGGSSPTRKNLSMMIAPPPAVSRWQLKVRAGGGRDDYATFWCCRIVGRRAWMSAGIIKSEII